jgi:hypothetical protein
MAKLLVFSPYAGILDHAKVEMDFSFKMKAHGKSVSFVRCDGKYRNFCITMAAFNLNEFSGSAEKEKICIKCKDDRDFMQTFPSLGTYNIDKFVDVNAQQQIERLLANINISNWHNFEFDGFPFGRYSAYETLLTHKLPTADISEQLWPFFKANLFSCLETYLGLLKILRTEKFEELVVYNFLYSANRSAAAAAEKMGIPVISLQANGPMNDIYSRYLIYPASNEYFSLNSSSLWLNEKRKCLNLKSILLVHRHLNAIFQAKNVWVYSKKAEGISKVKLCQKLGISEEKEVVLLTTSSQDELSAFNFVGLVESNKVSTQELFPDTISWIRHTIEIFRDLPDRTLVIRLHPREFSNRREGINSESGRRIVGYLNSVDLPANVVINTPDQEVSLYQLAPITSLLINGTSSVGVEFASLGIPSICVFPTDLRSYPSSLSIIPNRLQEYQSLLEFDYRNLFDRKFVVDSYKWINFRYLSVTQGISTISRIRNRLLFSRLYRKYFRKISMSKLANRFLLNKWRRKLKILSFEAPSNSLTTCNITRSAVLEQLMIRFSSTMLRKRLAKYID